MRRLSIAISTVVVSGWITGSVGAQQAHAAGKAPPAAQRQRLQKDRTLELLHELQRVVPQVAFDEVSFRDVLDWFREQGLNNILVKWPRVEAYGVIDRDTPVTLKLHNMTLGELLELVLDYVSMDSVEEGALFFHLDRGMVVISTRSDFANQLVVRTYEVEHLLQTLVFYNDSPAIPVGGSSSGGGGGAPGGGGAGPGGGGAGPGGGGGDGIFDGGGGGSGVNYEANREERIEAVLNTVRRIRPETWEANGGRGTVSVLGGWLIISQTIEMHEMLGGTFRDAVASRRSAGMK